MQPPLLCAGYQNATYNVTIYNNMDQIVEKIGPQQYTQPNNYSLTSIQEEVTLRDIECQYLRVVIDFKSIGVFVSNDSIVTIGKAVRLTKHSFIKLWYITETNSENTPEMTISIHVQ